VTRPALTAALLLCLLPALTQAQSYWSLTPSADLRARWNGDANNDNTGDANDTTGTYNATWSGTATYGTAPTGKGLGKSFSFNGASQITSSAVRTGTNARTWCGWVKTTDTTGVLFSIDDGTIGSSGTRWTVRLAGAGVLRIEIQGSGYTSSLDLNDGNWHFIAVTFSGTTLADHVLYMDGSSVNATGANSVNTSGTISRSGLGPTGVTDGEFTGEIYDSRLYTVALSAGDVAQIYAGPEPTLTSGSITIDQDGLTADTTSFSAESNGTLSYSWRWEEFVASQWDDTGYDDPDVGPSGFTPTPAVNGREYRLAKIASNTGGPADPVYSNEVEYVASNAAAHHYFQFIFDR
jgi:hypothetical protein